MKGILLPEDTMIGRYLAARKQAEARNDVNLVRECDFQLQKVGYRPDASAPQLAAAEQRAEEDVRPAKRPYVRRNLDGE